MNSKFEHEKGQGITAMKWKATLLTLIAATALCAQPPRTPMIDDIKAYLALSDTQVQTLQNLRTQEMNQVQSLAEQIRTKEQALKTLIDSGTTNAAQVGAAVLEIAALRKQMASIHSSFNTQAVAVLNDAQKTKLKVLSDAVALREEIAQATLLNLLVPPADGFGPGGPGMRGLGLPGMPGMGVPPMGAAGRSGPMMLRRLPQ